MTDLNFTPLLKYAEENKIEIYDDSLEKLNIYATLLKEWNEKINLTAITDDEGIVIKHFLDSLSVLNFIDINENDSLIDVGTGAGFPGMVLKILCPSLDVTLLDGHAKRFIFLEDLQKNIGLTAINLHKRAELAAKDPLYREKFSFATARAVARLNTLSEYCLPFVKVGGKFISLKGPDLENEAKESKKAIDILGGKILNINKFNLPNNDERAIAVIKKISATPKNYPRASAKINKSPII